MKILFTSILVLFIAPTFGQYYYNDLISNQQGNEQYKIYRAQRIHKIKAASFEADNTPTEGFLLEQDISLDGKKVTLSSAFTGGKTSITNRTYELNRLKRTVTGSNGIETRSDYTYTQNGQLQVLLITTTDTAMKSQSTEQHEWSFDANGLPFGMIKTKNKTDSIVVELIKDDQGLIIEERWKKKNRNLETYYYYYDGKKQLTDIVRFNNSLKKLVPDFQFEYDAQGRVNGMTQISLSASNYLIWKYEYNEKGLKAKEIAYAKEKRLVGSIVYTYEQ